jgi:hypothetical protein
MTEFHKNLIDNVIARIATEMARAHSDLYELQDYLGSFDCDDEGLTYPNGVSISMETLRGDK